MTKPKWTFYLIIAILLSALLMTVLPNPWLGILIGLGITAIVYFVPSLREKASDVGFGGTNQTYEALLKKARQDQPLVERLIAYEIKQNPDISREEGIERALDRWERYSR